MSDTGMYSNRYEQIRKFGDLLDEVLLELNVGSSTPTDPERRQLAELLIRAATQPTADFNVIQVATLLREHEIKPLDRWRQIGQALMTPKLPEAMLHDLERLAFRLDELRSEAVTKMRGVIVR